MALVGCTESETDNINNNQGGGNTEPSKTELTVNVTDLSFDAEADVKSIDISSSDAWTAEFVNDRASEWCSLSPTSGQAGNSSILVNVTENNSGEERSASIIIKAKSLQEVVLVTQMYHMIVIADKNYTIDHEGGEIGFKIGLNVDFDIEISDDWITQISTSDIETEMITFGVAANKSHERRVGTIKFYSKEHNITQTVKIIQLYDTSRPKNNEIYYTSSHGRSISPHKTGVFGSKIVSNTYENGRGVITFDGSVTTIGDDAFLNTNYLTSITIPDSVTEIGRWAFMHCGSLASVTLGNGVTSIGQSAFLDCESLTSVNIPDSVTEIGQYAFSGCSSLMSVIMGKSLTQIGDAAFQACISLASVAIGNSVTQIGDRAFWNCSSLTNVIIPDSVIEIGGEAFSGCSSLMSVIIGNSVTKIGDEAFSGCSSLMSVTMGNSVTKIGIGVFQHCSSLTNVIIPDSVIEIGAKAFSNCSSLTSVTIGKSVTDIVGGGTFDSCTNLESIYCKPITPPRLQYQILSDNVVGLKIYVPRGFVDVYKKADIWRIYSNYIVGYDFNE